MADLGSTQNLGPGRVLPGVPGYFWAGIQAPTEIRADPFRPNRQNRAEACIRAEKAPTYPEEPYPTPNFEKIPNLPSDSTGLPGITSYGPERVIWVGEPGSVFRPNRTEPNRYSKSP